MNKPFEYAVADTDSADQLRETLVRFQDEVLKVYQGEPAAVELMLTSLLANGHVLLDGVPGVAKTTLVRTFARCLGLVFRRVQFTPDLLPGDITGISIFDPGKQSFRFHPGPVFAQVLLADEVNRAPARTQSALLEAMQERQVTIDGTRHSLPDPFIVLATRNPIEHEGVYPLPEAQLDRFLIRLKLGYPGAEAETQMLSRHEHGAPSVVKMLSADDLERAKAHVDLVGVSEVIRRYIVALARATRSDSRVLLGASPRASLALQNAARAHAFLQGREWVDVKDVRHLVGAVWAHRIILTHRSESRGDTAESVIATILQQVTWDPV